MTVSPLRKLLREVKQVKHRAYPYLQKVAIETGLLPGNDHYVRFIILGRSRVGSNFLRGLLNSHSQAHVFGEIFQNKEEIAWAMPGYRQTAGDLQLFRQEPVQFVEDKVFHKFSPQITAVGFKIFYYHAQDPQWTPLWQYLQNDRSIKVIHIKRRNILKTHLSRQRAVQTDRWVNTSGEGRRSAPLSLSFEACLQDFQETRSWEEQYDATFHDHEMLEVIYEELAADNAAIMQRVQSFLGLQPETLTPETYKQSSAPLSEAIANYGELKSRFAGTPWHAFFVD
jgi:LPS sulfotransferase NodH